MAYAGSKIILLSFADYHNGRQFCFRHILISFSMLTAFLKTKHRVLFYEEACATYYVNLICKIKNLSYRKKMFQKKRAYWGDLPCRTVRYFW